MKRTKLIAAALVIAIMLMGAGYAYWQQDLIINTTVDTGELKLEFLPLLDYEFPDDHGGYDNALCEDDYINVDVDVESEKISFYIENIYPGSGGYLKFRIANTGTVPARVTGLTPVLSAGTSEEQLDKFDYVVRSLRLYTPKTGVKFVGWDKSKWIWKPIFEDFTYEEMIPVDMPIYANAFDDFVNKLRNKLDNYVLEPYAFFEINGEGAGYDIIMPPYINNDDGMQDIQGLGFDLNINFEQAH